MDVCIEELSWYEAKYPSLVLVVCIATFHCGAINAISSRTKTSEKSKLL